LRSRTPRRATLIAMLGALLLPLPCRAEEALASPLVNAFHEKLLGVMKAAESLGYDGRYQRLAPVLGRTFDTQFMAQKSVGRHWNDLEPDQKQLLLDTFERFMVANYAGRFDGWSGQSFETLGEEPSAQGTRIVHTRLVDPNGEDVELNYRVRSVADGWRIIDVYLNGTVSELALRRSENSSLVSREGFDALIAALDRRIGELARGEVED